MCEERSCEKNQIRETQRREIVVGFGEEGMRGKNTYKIL